MNEFWKRELPRFLELPYPEAERILEAWVELARKRAAESTATLSKRSYLEER